MDSGKQIRWYAKSNPVDLLSSEDQYDYVPPGAPSPCHEHKWVEVFASADAGEAWGYECVICGRAFSN
jgi:hypothetical protein